MSLYKKVKIRLENDFHHTEIDLFCRMPAGRDYVIPTAYQIRRAKEELCGIKCCCCSDDMGMRPGRLCVDDTLQLGEEGDRHAVEILKTMPGFYRTEYNNGTGRLIRCEGGEK